MKTVKHYVQRVSNDSELFEKLESVALNDPLGMVVQNEAWQVAEATGMYRRLIPPLRGIMLPDFHFFRNVAY